MTFVKYQSANNAYAKLAAWIDATSLVVLVDTGKGWLFPSFAGNPYLATIEEADPISGAITKREIVKVSNRVGDTFTIQRSQGYCPASETATSQTNTAFAFSSDAYIYLSPNAEYMKDIQDEISSINTSKLSVADYISGAKLYNVSTTGNDSYATTLTDVTSYAQIDGQMVRVKVDVDNTDAATLNINGLWAKNITKYGWDALLTWDINAGQIAFFVYNHLQNRFELVTAIDQSTSVTTQASIKSMTLWQTIASTKPVSMLPDGKIYRMLWLGNTGSTWLSTATSSSFQRSLALTNLAVIQLYANASGAIQVVCGTLADNDNVISYWTVQNWTPSWWNTWQWGVDLIQLSATHFAVVYTYANAGTSKFVEARIGSISGNTITLWAVQVLHNPWTLGMTFGGACLANTGKIAVSYTYNSSNHLVACTFTGVTFDAPWTAVSALAISGQCVYVSADKILIANTTDCRFYTFSGTTPTAWNTLSLWGTLTPYSIRDLWSWYSLYTGTEWAATKAFIINGTWATPAKGTTVTVLAASTSVDWVLVFAGRVVVVTGNNKFYFFKYSGTTLTATNNFTVSTWDYRFGCIAPIGQMKMICQIYTAGWSAGTTNSQFVTNMKVWLCGTLQQSGVLNDSRPVCMSGVSSGHSSISIWESYYYSNNDIVQAYSGEFFYWKWISATEILTDIPYSTL